MQNIDDVCKIAYGFWQVKKCPQHVFKLVLPVT